MRETGTRACLTLVAGRISAFAILRSPWCRSINVSEVQRLLKKSTGRALARPVVACPRVNSGSSYSANFITTVADMNTRERSLMYRVLRNIILEITFKPQDEIVTCRLVSSAGGTVSLVWIAVIEHYMALLAETPCSLV